MNEPKQPGHGTDPQEIEQLLNRLRESIHIFESKPDLSAPAETVTKVEAKPSADNDSLPWESQENAAPEEKHADEVAPEFAAEIIEDKPAIEGEVIIEDEAEAEDETIVEDEPAIEEEVVIEDEAEAEDETVIEDEPAIEEEVINDEQPEIKEEPIVEEESVALEEDTGTQTVSEMTETDTFTSCTSGTVNGIDLETLMNLTAPNTRVNKDAIKTKKYSVRMVSRPSSNQSPDTTVAKKLFDEVMVETQPASEASGQSDESTSGAAEASPNKEDVAQTVMFGVADGDSEPPLCEEAPVTEVESGDTLTKTVFFTNGEHRATRGDVAVAAEQEKSTVKKTLSGAAEASTDCSAFHIADMSATSNDHDRIEEFVSKDQVEAIYADYRAQHRGLVIRLMGAVSLFVLLLAVELLPLFGVSLKQLFALSGHDFITPLASLVLLLFCVPLSLPQIREGMAAFAQCKVVPECLYMTSFVWIAAYAAVNCFTYTPFTPLLCAAGASLTVGVILADLLRCSGEMGAFIAISAPGDKLAAELARVTVRSDEFDALKGQVFADTSRAIHVKKVEFVDGYFRQTKRRVEDFRLNVLLLIAINVAALTVGCLAVALLGADGMQGGLLAAAAVAFLATPVSFYLSHRYPVCRAQRIANGQHCAFIGESAVQAYTMADVMVFEDVEAFTSANTRICRIKLPDGVHVHQVLFYLTKAFGIVGGPLYGLFSTALEGIDDYSDTTLVGAEATGIHVKTGGHHVYIGRSSYLAKNGITPYYDDEDEKYIAEGKVSLMYVAVDGAFMAKFYIRYEPNEKFCHNARELAKRRMRMLLRTFDPNLDERLLKSNHRISGLPVKIVHKRPEQLYDYAQARMYSGLVTAGSTKDILKLVLLCDSVKRVTAFGRILKIITAAVAPVSVLLLAAFGKLALLSAPLVVAYWALTLLPLAIVTRRKL